MKAISVIAKYRERYPVRDARKESYLKARNKMILISTLRPPIKQIPWARSLWQVVKKAAKPKEVRTNP